jgi:hypothetical protein
MKSSDCLPAFRRGTAVVDMTPHAANMGSTIGENDRWFLIHINRRASEIDVSKKIRIALVYARATRCPRFARRGAARPGVA